MEWQCQNFDQKLGNSSLCACAIQIWPKEPTTTGATSEDLKLLCIAVTAFPNFYSLIGEFFELEAQLTCMTWDIGLNYVTVSLYQSWGSVMLGCGCFLMLICIIFCIHAFLVMNAVTSNRQLGLGEQKVSRNMIAFSLYMRLSYNLLQDTMRP